MDVSIYDEFVGKLWNSNETNEDLLRKKGNSDF